MILLDQASKLKERQSAKTEHPSGKEYSSAHFVIRDYDLQETHVSPAMAQHDHAVVTAHNASTHQLELVRSALSGFVIYLL